MTDQQPPVPVKSEGKVASIVIEVLEDALKEQRELLRAFQLEKENVEGAVLSASVVEWQIKEIESAIRILEYWPEVKRVLGEYGDENNWWPDRSFPIKTVFRDSTNGAHGYEPAQSVLDKMNAELLIANNACGFKQQQPDEPDLHHLSQE